MNSKNPEGTRWAFTAAILLACTALTAFTAYWGREMVETTATTSGTQYPSILQFPMPPERAPFLDYSLLPDLPSDQRSGSRRDYSRGSWRGIKTGRHLTSDADVAEELEAVCGRSEGDECRQSINETFPVYEKHVDDYKRLEVIDIVRRLGFRWTFHDGEPLEHASPAEFLHRFAGKTIALVGDSLTSQFLHILDSWLGEHRISTLRYSHDNAFFMNDDERIWYNTHVREPPKTRNGLTIHHYRGDVKIIFQFIGLPATPRSLFAEHLTAREALYDDVWFADYLVLNVAAWYSNHVHKPEAIPGDVAEWLDDLRPRFGSRLYFREYWGVAFTSHDEFLEPKKPIPLGRTVPCLAIEDVLEVGGEQLRNNPRVDATNEAVEGRATLIPHFNMTASRPDLHLGNGDCRHFSLAWSELFEAMVASFYDTLVVD